MLLGVSPYEMFLFLGTELTKKSTSLNYISGLLATPYADEQQTPEDLLAALWTEMLLRYNQDAASTRGRPF